MESKDNTPQQPTQNSSLDQLANLTSNHEVVMLAGREVKIHKVKVKNLTQVISLVSPFISEIKAGKISNGSSDFVELVEIYTPSVVELAALLSDLSKDEIGDLEIDDMVSLVTKIIGVNADFFTKKVLPQLLGAMAQLSVAAKEMPRTLGQK